MTIEAKALSAAVLHGVGREMYGLDEVIRLCLVALFAEGHVLLEGNPGMGKTELVKTLGKVLSLQAGRIQFTPDLMPADITGTFRPDYSSGDSREWRFQPGPIFTSLLLADEINRATPKTQSAMLEAMAERQVTVLGEQHNLPLPFMVLATQNPIDHQGTYRLPEAQADRFMFKVAMPVPGENTVRRILGKRAGALSRDELPPNGSAPAGDALLPRNAREASRLHEKIGEQIRAVEPLPALETHILNMYLASNRRFGELEGLEKRQVARLQILVESVMDYGLGPRAVIALMLGAKAWTLLFAADAVAYADGPALARVVIPALRHRVLLHLDWEEAYTEKLSQGRPPVQDGRLLESMLADFCLCSAPRDNSYARTVEAELARVLAGKEA